MHKQVSYDAKAARFPQSAQTFLFLMSEWARDSPWQTKTRCVFRCQGYPHSLQNEFFQRPVFEVKIFTFCRSERCPCVEAMLVITVPKVRQMMLLATPSNFRRQIADNHLK